MLNGEGDLKRSLKKKYIYIYGYPALSLSLSLSLSPAFLLSCSLYFPLYPFSCLFEILAL